jgi:hypothetical protein
MTIARILRAAVAAIMAMPAGAQHGAVNVNGAFCMADGRQFIEVAVSAIGVGAELVALALP